MKIDRNRLVGLFLILTLVLCLFTDSTPKISGDENSFQKKISSMNDEERQELAKDISNRTATLVGYTGLYGSIYNMLHDLIVSVKQNTTEQS